MFEVERDIPMPRRYSKYPWDDMKVGDSFFGPGLDEKARSRLNAAAYYRGKTRGGRYLVRKVTGGVRIWRVE